MLKRLELVGFKSFADRTWFSFPPGLTAIVGPNGSGKSNVVDAVKWILGEQSAKSLRRGIFEEAAGISRFKAKKQEALRKLEHTAENLTRLRDILGEVEARLRRVRLDAEKARKFQEYGGRLRDLRLGIGLREYHALTE